MFLQEFKKEFLYITAYVMFQCVLYVVSLKCSSIKMVHWIELKFGMYIIGHRPTYCVEFGEFKINSFFTGVQK